MVAVDRSHLPTVKLDPIADVAMSDLQTGPDVERQDVARSSHEATEQSTHHGERDISHAFNVSPQRTNDERKVMEVTAGQCCFLCLGGQGGPALRRPGLLASTEEARER